MKIKLFTVPNMLTSCNLLCGSICVMQCFAHENLQIAFWLIIAAAIFDFLDGMAARLLGSYSEVGKELDSLADMVSFGLAPAAIMSVMYTQSLGDSRFVPLIFIVTIFSALRLAKFNIDPEQSDDFIGLPTPACALFVASSGYLFSQGVFSINPYYIIGIALCLSVLLVSNKRMFSLKFKNLSLKDNSLRFGFLLVSLVGLIVFQILAIPFIIVLYILISLTKALVKK